VLICDCFIAMIIKTVLGLQQIMELEFPAFLPGIATDDIIRFDGFTEDVLIPLVCRSFCTCVCVCA
jgi:hypothetical protein